MDNQNSDENHLLTDNFTPCNSKRPNCFYKEWQSNVKCTFSVGDITWQSTIGIEQEK